jgi:predicted CoA-binding protein
MPTLPANVATFLAGKRFAVFGVSRQRDQPANAIFRKLRDSGFEVFPVNPNAAGIEGVRCYPGLASIAGPIDGAVVVTPSRAGVEVVRQCAEKGVRQVWFHRSVGEGSVSEDAVRECGALGIACIVGGCPMMYCEPVDPAHRCMRWVLGMCGRVPR